MPEDPFTSGNKVTLHRGTTSNIRSQTPNPFTFGINKHRETRRNIETRRSGISFLVATVVVLVVAVAVVGVSFLVLSGRSASSGSNITCDSTPSSSAASIQISIYSGASSSTNAPGYTPDKISLVIGKNNTVTWTNNDAAHHTVTTSNAPAGASFNSGDMAQGATYTCTFTEPGTYQYTAKTMLG
jgi:plastocyanin